MAYWSGMGACMTYRAARQRLYIWMATLFMASAAGAGEGTGANLNSRAVVDGKNTLHPHTRVSYAYRWRATMHEVAVGGRRDTTVLARFYHFLTDLAN